MSEPDPKPSVQDEPVNLPGGDTGAREEPAVDAYAGLLKALQLGTEAERLEAVRLLHEGKEPRADVLQALEKSALKDESEAVRAAALTALADPLFTQIQFHRTNLAYSARNALRAEVDRWEIEGLVEAELAEVLRARYPLSARPPAKKKKPGPLAQSERTSLAQVLLSEASVQVALYLGALFTLAAAAIFASAFEGLRLVILGATTLVFFASAGLLFIRLRQASFIMYLIAGVLLLVDAGVLFDSVSIPRRQIDLFWAAALGFAGIIWILGGTAYRSALFSLFWLWSWTVGSVFAGIWLDEGVVPGLFLVSLATLTGLPGAWLFRRLKARMGTLTYVFAALQMGLVFSLMILGFLLITMLEETLLWQDWLWLAGTGLVISLFWAGSEWIRIHPVFRFLAVTALLSVPLWLMGAAQPTIRWAGIGITVWGVVLALWGELARRAPLDRARAYAPFLLWGAFPIFLLAGAVGHSDAAAAGTAYIFLAALVYAGAYAINKDPATWTAGLFFGLLTYFSLFTFPSIRSLGIYPAHILAPPAMISLLAAAITADRVGTTRQRILLAGGALLAVVSAWLGLTLSPDEPAQAALLFAAWGLFFLAYERFTGQRPLFYLAIAGFSLAFTFLLVRFEVRFWLLAEATFAAALFFSGLLLGRRARLQPAEAEAESGEETESLPASHRARALQVSVLAIAGLVALAAPLQDDGSAVLGVAVLAGLFALEAFRRRNIWLGFPANLLLLEAWFLGLVFFEVRQPQYFSIAAAMLGIVMHYLLVRGSGGAQAPTGSKLAAFVTGLLAVMTLLSTTYIQLVSSGEFTWFFLLFPQALAVLAYGLVVRSRSFVIVPIGFIILTVLTAVFILAEGVYALPLLACCGFLLLGLGVAALLARERLLEATETLRNRPGSWQA